MKKYIILFLIISLSSCNGGRLGELLIGAHRQLHNKVHDVADAVIGGFGFTHGHHHQPPPQPPNQGGETIVVIVEENSQGGQGNPRPYQQSQQGHYPTPNGHNPYQGQPNNGYNQGNQNNGHRPHGYDPQLNYPANPGHDPYQNGNKYGNDGQQLNIPSYPNQQGQYNNDQDHNQINQNNNAINNNGNHHPTGNPTNVINNPYPTANEVKSPEPTKTNSNDNYKPTETYIHQDKNNMSSKKPEEDGPLLVPLNGYTYEGDKIVINAPKRETGNGNQKNEESEEDFPIDIRFKDE
ncbi:probable serine/threonine-protein kinase clkA [Cydia fagiglandana]|uniref:probable serine/threonine-protein kinase clkA n=1 Tax=Cydia fagiglandana TaxID=1458189 RepID=UPI002FEE429D